MCAIGMAHEGDAGSSWATELSRSRRQSRGGSTDAETTSGDRTPPRLPLERPGSIEEEYDFGMGLGEGGFGVVTLGTCRATGEKVAVKQILADRLQTPSRIESELSIAAELHHPHVARLFEVYSGSGGAQWSISGGPGWERCGLVSRAPRRA